VDCKLNYTDSNYQIWNVTDPAQIKQINLDWHNDGTVHFYQPIDTIARFVAVKKNIFEVPIIIGPVSNQDALQPKAAVNYIIITAPAYLNAAIKYQQFQINQKGRNAIVINAAELYNDFSGGVPTAIAIRNYLKNAMNHAIENNWTMPEYALLLGLGNFNSKSLRPNFEIPVYETENSNSILNSYTTDDFYAVLNENDDINNPSSIKKLNIALGRIPVSSPQEADSVVNKLIAYQSNLQGGSWENKLTWIADDGDYNLHLQDAESIVGHLQASTNYWNHEKIYLDLFPAVASTSGNTYPLANSALQQSVLDGTLMINYTGHGNYLRLSEEAIISKDQIDNWDNPYKLPLLVTASCNFAPYDQTSIRPIAWDALMKNGKGIIGLVAASRLVFAYSNKQINDLFIQQLLVPNVNGKFWSLGNALMNAKMNNWLNGGDQINSFKFSLIGDPALTLSTPNRQLVVNQINNLNFSGKDTLLSGSKNNIKGQLKSNGKMDAGFNGILDLNVYDVIKYKKTLANQSTSMSVPIALQESLLFKGKASIVKGLYAIDFVLPNQATGTSSPLRMELAASGDMSSAILVLDSIYVKPNTNIQIKDTLGPQIKAYLNDSLFKSGNWATPNSTLYINLKDSAGIQSAGNVLGHDLSIWIDDNKLPIVLNNYYSADLDSYQSGKITYPLPVFSTGKHKLVIKAWDVLGNSNIDSVVFEVPLDQSLSIRNAFNFPNPFLNTTNFSVETNQVGKEVQIGLEVADVAGNLKYSVSAKFFNTKNIINIPWNGLTNTGSKLQPGVYFYKFVLKTSTETGFISNRILKL
jgi:hypothetical protein